ncbi:SDR family NAD(P)-dependent oxidoreductase [Streptomyces sp. NPDC051896]|uniref:SDR family NAD(P)-dependent oxidoreductase n=1 Tax=Streptomyces sp. NPDC051896 TaxID=3155416 RepID=UPI00342D7D39
MLVCPSSRPRTPQPRDQAAVRSVGDRRDLADGSPTDKLDRMIAVNVRGVFLSMRHELRYMVTQGSGSIVNMSSGAELVGVPGFSATRARRRLELVPL